MTLLDCIDTLLDEPDADRIRLDDGANTWDLDNLRNALCDALRAGDAQPDGREYIIEDGAIYALNEIGQFTPMDPVYRISLAPCAAE